ncbi:MAG: hypothetical protein QG657_5109 [Acidobacteriota bacterium]|nr:hypothetical protein [Acidobacteriota bacterium]
MEKIKLFIYDSNGKVVEERNSATYFAVLDEVNERNLKEPDDKWHIVMGFSFPPPGTKWDTGKKELVSMTLHEKADMGLVTISPKQKIVGDAIIPKTTKELVEDGLIKLEPDEKLSEDGGRIVKKSELEQLKQGVITVEEFGDIYKNKLRAEMDKLLELVFNKYPFINDFQEFYELKEQVIEWNLLDETQRGSALTDTKELLRFAYLFKEAGADLKDIKESKDKIGKFVDIFIRESGDFEQKVGEITIAREETHHKIEVALKLKTPGKIYKAVQAAFNKTLWPVI